MFRLLPGSLLLTMIIQPRVFLTRIPLGGRGMIMGGATGKQIFKNPAV